MILVVFQVQRAGQALPLCVRMVFVKILWVGRYASVRPTLSVSLLTVNYATDQSALRIVAERLMAHVRFFQGSLFLVVLVLQACGRVGFASNLFVLLPAFKVLASRPFAIAVLDGKVITATSSEPLQHAPLVAVDQLEHVQHLRGMNVCVVRVALDHIARFCIVRAIALEMGCARR